jgi:hypothetical protein
VTLRRLLPVAVLLATVFALIIWWAPPAPADLPDCAAAPRSAQFCAVLPTNAVEASPAAPPFDHVSPCTSPAAPGASFCVALPTPGPAVDRTELLARRQDACAQLEAGEAPDFCLVVPTGGASTSALQRDIALALLRQRLGTDFRRTTAGGVQLWTEIGVSAPIVDRAVRLIGADAAAVEEYFGRRYQEPPSVFLFMSQQSFGLALQRHFGVSSALAVQMSQQLLGVLLTGSDAVAINGQSIATSGRPVVYRHELAHVLIHQLAGDGVANWLDEGLATHVSALEPEVIDPLRASALASLRTDRRALSIFTDTRDWQTVNSAYGNRAYGVAAEAVFALERRVGRAGVTTLLESIGRGTAFEDAFGTVVGQTFDDFIALLPTVVH